MLLLVYMSFSCTRVGRLRCLFNARMRCAVVQASLEADQYGLAAELLRFLIPPGDNDILAAMPSHAAVHGHTNGKPSQSAATPDAGVCI